MTVLYMNSIYLFDNYLARFFLQREMFQTKVEEKIEKKNIFCSIAFFFEILAVCEIIGKIRYSLTYHRYQYGACAHTI